MDIAQIAAIGLPRVSAGDAPAQIAREFDAMLLGMLWRGAAAPGPHKSGAAASAAPLGELFVQQLATQHSAGFGALLLRALDQGG
jgi:hypothetical protein